VESAVTPRGNRLRAQVVPRKFFVLREDPSLSTPPFLAVYALDVKLRSTRRGGAIAGLVDTLVVVARQDVDPVGRTAADCGLDAVRECLDVRFPLPVIVAWAAVAARRHLGHFEIVAVPGLVADDRDGAGLGGGAAKRVLSRHSTDGAAHGCFITNDAPREGAGRT
jgi:hypothetical protein